MSNTTTQRPRMWRGWKDAPDDWFNNVVILWKEDDAKPVDRERGSEAFKRISNKSLNSQEPIAEKDFGDSIYKLYSGGWVHESAYDGEGVGILVVSGDN